jgi:hypothetical protein
MSSKRRWPTRERERKAKRVTERRKFGEGREEGSVESSRVSGDDGLRFRERCQRTRTTGIYPWSVK